MDVSGSLSLVQFVIEKLGSPIWTQIEAALGLESELDKLRETMSTIEAVLLDAEVEERLHEGCRTYVERNKLKRLKEALYRADDLFDEITTLGHLEELLPCNKNKVCLFFSCSNQFRSAITWSQEMEKISEMLDDIVKDHRYDFGSRHPAGLDAAKQMRINARETHSYVCEDDVMIGRDDDKRKVINMLLNTSVEQQDGFVVSIVGIGGLGKTTLARQVYNDEMIGEKFPRKLWVCVSDDFNVKALVGHILTAVNPTIKLDNDPKLEELQMKLRQEMDDKKYLLVLDDLWNEDPNKWHDLRNVLIGNGRVSRIIVTTRSKKVADVVESRWTHELKGLSDDESLDLFKKMALKPEEHPVQQQLVDIGKEIVRKCANVPLAIRVVGSLLRGQDESRWQYLQKTDLANILQDENNGILPVLKISYNYLPFHLKSCFSYCAVFPKDYKIIKEDLIRLWMAQGFIMPLIGESFEDTGEKYFEELLQRCFFQDVERSMDTDEIISFKMHDLIHDLAAEVAGTEILLSSNCKPSCFNERTRHISIDESSERCIDKNSERYTSGDLVKMKRLRTFLYTGRLYFWLKLSKMKSLRVLRLNLGYNCPIKFPSVIGNLVHLRYFDLSHNMTLQVLPSSITKLYNLQTLKLRECESLRRLPRDLRKLVNLRQLDIYGCSRLTCMPPGMNEMTSLQNLTRFVVGGTSNGWDRGSAVVVKLGYLKELTRHSEILEVEVKKGVRYNAVEAREEGFLSESQKLRKVKYEWSIREDDNAVALLQSLQPHSNLGQLMLWCYPGVRLPTRMMNLKTCLPNLVQIKITNCERLEHLPLVSQLRHLKVLELKGLNEVEYVESSSNIISGDDELVFFPSLEKLILYDMPKLKGWWKSSSTETGESETPQAPVLSHLQIKYCPNLTTFPLCPGLQELELSYFNEALGPIMRETTHAFSVSNNNNHKEEQGQRQGRLREVTMSNVGYFTSLPIHHLSNLSIEFDEMEGLRIGKVGEVFQSGRLSSLRSLTIAICKNLKSISGRGVWEHFTALESLKLIQLPELELKDEDDVSNITNKSTAEGCININNQGSDAEMSWRYLAPTLCSLVLWNLPKVVKLPNGIGCLSSLHSLRIFDCGNLESLTPSIGGLSSLHSLLINYCRKLKTMPEEMRHLTSLTKLDISGCSPELKNECKNKTGANWSNIQHVPYLKIEYDDY